MTFIWPVMLFLLVLAPLSVWLYARQQKRRRKMMAKTGGLGFAQAAGSQGPGVRRHIPSAFFLAGLMILVLALARPQAVVSLPHTEGTVILAFDVSGSMAATDMQPSRIEAAKAAARDFVARQPKSVLIGVVAFSDNGFSVQMPTDDSSQVLAAINRLTPQRGTSLANGIQASLNTIIASRTRGVFGDTSGEPAHLTDRTPTPTPSPTPLPKGTYTSAVVVLLTDGENNENPDPLAAARAAADRGVRIYTVGIGSPTGSDLKIGGFIVHTQLDEDMLKQISQISDGAYYNAQSAEDLQAIYENIAPQLTIKAEKTEITSLFAGASILVFLIGGAFSLAWFSRLP